MWNGGGGRETQEGGGHVKAGDRVGQDDGCAVVRKRLGGKTVKEAEAAGLGPQLDFGYKGQDGV